jgi:hypothetical protein
MIHDLVLRWIVTGLSVLSGAEWLDVIAARRREWKFVVSYALHLVMAIAMAVMAWPWGAHLPAAGAAVFFLVAAAWFVAVTLVWARTAPRRTLRSYHAVMMLAMASMYTTMDLGMPEPMDMPGMDMSEMPMPNEPPVWVATVNGFWFAVFAVATGVWAYLAIAERREPAPTRRPVLYAAAQAAMAAGMATSFAAMLFQL